MEQEVLEPQVKANNKKASHDVSLEARAYFLNQGQNINRLNDILDNNLVSYHFKTIASLVAEVLLYILFTATIGFVISIPSAPEEISYSLTRFLQSNDTLTSDDLSMMVLTFKFFISLLSLPLLGMAVLLRRNRNRRKMVNRAAGEAYQMKTAFYKAVNELKL